MDLLHHTDLNFYDSPVEVCDLRKCSPRQVDDSPFNKWASVIDSDRNRFAVIQICNFHFSTERQGFVSCCHCIVVKSLTAGSLSVMKFHRVIGSYSCLSIYTRIRMRLVPRYTGTAMKERSNQQTDSESYVDS